MANRIATYLHTHEIVSRKHFTSLAVPPRLEGGLVHLLDHGTEGLLMAALDQDAKLALRNTFSSHPPIICKTYHALVHGCLDSKAEGSLEFFIWGQNSMRCASLSEPARHANKDVERMKMNVKMIGKGRNHSLVEISTSSGGRHVVRVGLALLGHPIVNDTIYARIEEKKRMESVDSDSNVFNNLAYEGKGEGKEPMVIEKTIPIPAHEIDSNTTSTTVKTSRPNQDDHSTTGLVDSAHFLFASRLLFPAVVLDKKGKVVVQAGTSFALPLSDRMKEMAKKLKISFS